MKEIVGSVARFLLNILLWFMQSLLMQIMMFPTIEIALVKWFYGLTDSESGGFSVFISIKTTQT